MKILILIEKKKKKKGFETSSSTKKFLVGIKEGGGGANELDFPKKQAYVGGMFLSVLGIKEQISNSV